MQTFTRKRIFKFIPNLILEGGHDMKAILGGKGAGLCEMAKIGVPVPPGFIISTDTCLEYYSNDRTLPEELLQETFTAIDDLEKSLNKKFGSGPDPLLVSCRSGAKISMPGMMDTVLNIGFTDEVFAALKDKNGEVFALDTYRRFMQMYGTVVLGMPDHEFRKVTSLEVEHLREIVKSYERVCNGLIPCDPWQQLITSISAVFDSWYNERAVIYRRTYDIPEDWGTAATIVAMVYGNKDEESGTGVVFSRNPSTGENKLFGEYLETAQGEDVVRGSATPKKLEELEKKNKILYDELKKTCTTLEKYFKDTQDIEFTIESGKLWILQTRSAKRTAHAAVKIAHDFFIEGKVSSEIEALKLIRPEDLEQFLSPHFDQDKIKSVKSIANGIAASPGAACGKIVFSAKLAIELKDKNPEQSFILIRPETVPDDIGGMKACAGFLTAVGGASSHAALVARQMGKPCIVGCNSLTFKESAGTILEASIEGHRLKEFDFLSIDGQTGQIFLGEIPTVNPDPEKQKNQYNAFNWVMETCDIKRRLGIWVNADSSEQCSLARKFGAEGVGLCRTEHQFFDSISIFQAVLFGESENSISAKEILLQKQTQDFYNMFKIMSGLPVTIRLLDPPLHEFLPKTDEDIQKVAKLINISNAELKILCTRLKESNPMLGFRGCRLGILRKEITDLQINAIFSAAKKAIQDGFLPVPYIMVPLAATKKELKIIYDEIHATAKNKYSNIMYYVGSMIELPRACIIADEIAAISDFVSFGTNDLTQTTLGISRDDCASFMEDYLKLGIYPKDPFQSLDIAGVGFLIKEAVLRAREANPTIKIGICGEHGGDPESIKFFRSLGFDSVSCAPKRLPTAKLAAIL